MPLNTDDAATSRPTTLPDSSESWQPPSPGHLAEASDRIARAQELFGPTVCRRLGIYRLPQTFLLSVVIPVYNELATIDEIIRRVRNCGIRCELILIDDGSTDGTRQVLEGYRGQGDITLLLHETNQGKGAALKTGFSHARGDLVMIQDADLEYDPGEFSKLIQPIVEDKADVVYGTRFNGDSRRVQFFWHTLGNRVLTLLSNMRTNLNLSDMEVCYKVFRRELIQKIAPTLREKRFGIEPEMTAKIARIPNVRIFERPINYSGRTYAQGKKIGWRDGIRALWCIARY